MAKEEPHEPAVPGNQKSPGISPRSFQSRLAEWSEQCLRFQASGETWVPTKPCCPASPFLGLEACLWQGCKKQEPTACVQLLSIEELLELYDFFREDPSVEDHPEAGFGSEPRLDVRPWMRDLPTGVWAGGFRLENGMLKLSPSSCGSAAQCHEGSFAEPGETHTQAVVEPRPKRQRAGRWNVQPRDTATKKGGRRGTTKVNEKAEAQKAKKSKRKKAPLSAVKGVYFCCRHKLWRVCLHNPSSQKQVSGGYFKVQREAEAKARKLAKELGLRTKRKLISAAASHFEPLGTQKGIRWGRGAWRSWFRFSESKKKIEATFAPDDLSTTGVEKAWKKAVAWRKQQEKQQLKQASKR
ncbi:unnamed protein product [Symbiodinium microadriaticum]|nr:unnamed protein product [Symbiodinium sp. KB8]CAE7879463.1 unnamed protein product [Symbiodinium microadriaticum]